MSFLRLKGLQVGDVLPPAVSRQIWTDNEVSGWYIFTVPPRGEVPASVWMERNGVAETWYPSETAFKRNRFKPNVRVPYQRPVTPGYLFAYLPLQPQWDVLFDRSRGKILRVVSHNGQPVAISQDTLAKMRLVPQRLAAIREAEIQRRTIYPKDKVSVNIAGVEWTVEVECIHAGIASFVLPLLGGRVVQAPVEALTKQPLA